MLGESDQDRFGDRSLAVCPCRDESSRRLNDDPRVRVLTESDEHGEGLRLMAGEAPDRARCFATDRLRGVAVRHPFELG